MGESPARFPGDHQPAVRRHGLLLRTSHRTVFRRNPADIHPADAGRQPLQKLRPGGLLHRRGDLVLSGILRRDGVPPVARSAQTENTGIAARDFGIRAQPDRNRHPPGSHHRAELLHRPRHRDRHRRNDRYRAERQNLPGRHAGRHVCRQRAFGRPASSDHRGQRDHLRRQHDPRRRHGDRPRHGDNVWLTESVPPHSTVYCKPEIVIKGKRTKK